jgi:hypothetical protein
LFQSQLVLQRRFDASRAVAPSTVPEVLEPFANNIDPPAGHQ